MGFFDHIQKKGSTAIKAQPAQVRKERVLTPGRTRKTQNSTLPLLPRAKPKVPNAKRGKNSAHQTSKPRAQSSRKRASSAQARLESDSDESSTDGALQDSRKRVRQSTDVEVDTKRQVRCLKAFSNEDGGLFPMVRAADIASLSKPIKYRAAFPEFPQAKEIFLQYPSASQRERFVPSGLWLYNQG